MNAAWFLSQVPPSRHAIENELRLSFWRAGYGQMWFTCTQDQPPFECHGLWNAIDFNVEWEPRKFVLLKMKEPNQELLAAFERVLKHNALAAYRNGNGIVVEWRAKNPDARFQELRASNVQDLERLNK